MKRPNNRSKRAIIVTLALCAGSCVALGQGPGGPGGGPDFGPGGPGGGPGGPGGHRPHHRPPPVIVALDTNHDRIIDASEIANSAASLKTLLESGSDSLNIGDLLGPPPRGSHWHGMQQSGTTGDDGLPPPPPDGQGGAGGDENGPPPPPPPPPLPPVIQALDTNHDGIIEADEIANAPQSLKTLFKSGSDSLTIPDLLGPPPPRPDGQGPPPPPEQSGTNGAPPPPDGQGPPPPPPDQTGTNAAQGAPPPPPPQ